MWNMNRKQKVDQLRVDTQKRMGCITTPYTLLLSNTLVYNCPEITIREIMAAVENALNTFQKIRSRKEFHNVDDALFHITINCNPATKKVFLVRVDTLANAIDLADRFGYEKAVEMFDR